MFRLATPWFSGVFLKLKSCYPTYFIVPQFLHFRMKSLYHGLAYKPPPHTSLASFCPAIPFIIIGSFYTPVENTCVVLYYFRESCPCLLTRFLLILHDLGKDLLGTSLTHTRDWSFPPLFSVGGSHLNYNIYLFFSLLLFVPFFLKRASHRLQDP